MLRGLVLKSLLNNCLPWLKALLIVGCLLGIRLAFASDVTGISDLNTQLDNGKSTLGAFARWGGITVIVTGALVIGSGRAKGEVANWLWGIAIMIGIICAAWGYFKTQFADGFVF